MDESKVTDAGLAVNALPGASLQICRDILGRSDPNRKGRGYALADLARAGIESYSITIAGTVGSAGAISAVVHHLENEYKVYLYPGGECACECRDAVNRLVICKHACSVAVFVLSQVEGEI